MGKIAFMFPGQGAQCVGMAKDFYDTFEDSKEVFDKANEVLDFDLLHICFEENEDIHVTEFTQPALVTACVAILKQVEKSGVKPDVCAGLSLGEYAALVATGAMASEDAIKVVRERGKLMQGTVPAGEGAMSAVLAMDKEKIEEVLAGIDGEVSIANYNCPGQIVITGETTAVQKAGEALAQAGAKRVVPLKVSGPFHSPMLKPAGEKLLEVLEDVTLNEMNFPYIANATADYVNNKEDIKELLGVQVYSSVKMQQTIEKMIADGVDTFVEIGPSKTIAGFIKKIDRGVTVINIEKVEDLVKLQEIAQ